MCGYYLYESAIFGAALWVVFNSVVAPYIHLPLMGYENTVGILFVIKILFFDATKIKAVE